MIKYLTIIQIELEFGNVKFRGEGKTGVPGEKPLGARTRRQQQTAVLYIFGKVAPDFHERHYIHKRSFQIFG